MGYAVSSISPSDRRGQSAVDALLLRAGIQRDALIDYTCGVFDDDYALCATGSCFGATLRCMAVDPAHQGEGLMNLVVSHLCAVQAERGNTRLFLYTKPSAASVFSDLGFYEIARVPDRLVFMENRRTGFSDWLGQLTPLDAPKDRTAAVVMNANPFTKGHRYLIERALEKADVLHLFVLSEEFGPIPSAVRRELVRLGTEDMKGIVLHDSGPYIISSATFPSYFLKAEETVSEAHAHLDLKIFARIAERLHIGARYVGEEPNSEVTALYNRVMIEQLPKSGIECRVVERLKINGCAVSASTVRAAIHDGRMESVRTLLPDTTWRYLNAPEGRGVVEAIQKASQVVHH